MNKANKEIILPYIFVIGNEKGGAGKTTFAMHLIAALLDKKLKVGSIDTDSRQHSLTTYIQNRNAYNAKHVNAQIPVPLHFLITVDNNDSTNASECQQFENAINELRKKSDVIVIDTPGSYSAISCLAHSYADTIITPVNDSFLDIDVLAKIDAKSLKIITPSIYSQMVWEQKMRKTQRCGLSIEWVVVRNRLSNLDAVNKRNINYVLEQLAKRVCFKNASGFSERVIFKELFLEGLTLLDLTKAELSRNLNIAQVAARQELRDFLDSIDINKIIVAAKIKQ
ncbi:cobQ/CobB/MinD/ParA nucleotide binding domain protein [Orientia chuto str. Dubai]|uniref:CobQ/CobB/MinD/ParA nucleotide binding domain protein n=1 Tax=Orientia chuto str. Dubai TaxID=1359168 RepID=A0A0F3MRQ3_9RICK|nr:division plane positioning ATPase MipZ [Candidatus Orientia mediorientalis]KJV57279.1 cobQ/CobB/MinD/ParA nucleotide binding domain protein [Orientia chuto str. Dubai]